MHFKVTTLALTEEMNAEYPTNVADDDVLRHGDNCDATRLQLNATTVNYTIPQTTVTVLNDKACDRKGLLDDGEGDNSTDMTEINHVEAPPQPSTQNDKTQHEVVNRAKGDELYGLERADDVTISAGNGHGTGRGVADGVNTKNPAPATTNSNDKNCLKGAINICANSPNPPSAAKTDGHVQNANTVTTSTVKSKGNNQPQHLTSAKTSTDKVRQFRQAFTSAKTSAIAKRQLEHRQSDVQTGPFHNKYRRKPPRGSINSSSDARRIVNCANKVNLTFRQSDSGSKANFAEHFNFRNKRKRNYSRESEIINPGGHGCIKLNSTALYSPKTSPKKSLLHHKKDPQSNMNSTSNTMITIKPQQTPRIKTKERTLSKLIDDVHDANAPSICDAISLTHAQKEAMATFRSTRGPQVKKYVPPEFQKQESTRQVKVAKRKSIVVSDKLWRKHDSSAPMVSPRPQQRPDVSDKPSARPPHRRKLSMEETLERYRSRVTARSPCTCQTQKDVEKVSNAAWASHSDHKPGRLKAHPDISPPLVTQSRRLKPITHKSI